MVQSQNETFLKLIESSEPILVSGCLLGIKCVYNLENREVELIKEITQYRTVIPICPEQLGGLATPRTPQCINKGSGFDVLDKKALVIDRDGINVTDNFIQGANEALKIAKLAKVKEAILKERSPSCGVTEIYNNMVDDKRKVAGSGVTASLLIRNGIEVYSEDLFKE